MLVVMNSHATEEQIHAVCKHIESLGLKAHPMPGSLRTAIGITGNKGAIDLGILESLPGVVECIPVSKPYKLVSRDTKQEDSILRIPTPSGDVIVGGDHIALVAGPCAVETEEQCLAIAERLKKSGVRLFRGGAYKPRTSPYSFQGLGEEGLKILCRIFLYSNALAAPESPSSSSAACQPRSTSSSWPPSTCSPRAITTLCCASAVCALSPIFHATPSTSPSFRP